MSNNELNKHNDPKAKGAVYICETIAIRGSI